MEKGKKREKKKKSPRETEKRLITLVKSVASQEVSRYAKNGQGEQGLRKNDDQKYPKGCQQLYSGKQGRG